jgi:hypothetical protein
MQRRVIIVLGFAILILFGIWRPLSEPTVELFVTPAAESDILPTILFLPDGCGAAPPTRLAVGMEGHVALASEGNGVRRNLFVRAMPGGERVGIMEPGTNFRITGESICDEENQRWWPIETDDFSGWSVEGFAPDDYVMMPGAN